MSFEFKKRVAFHETDCMGVVHHANYAKYFEEARVDFLYKNNLNAFHSPQTDYVLAVLDLEIKYYRPLRVGDEFRVELDVEALSPTKVKFTYQILNAANEVTTSGSTLHVGLDGEFKVQKIPEGLKKGLQIKKEKYSG